MAHSFEVLRANETEQATSAIPIESLAGNGHIRTRRENSAGDEVAKLAQRVFILPGSAKAPGAVVFCGVENGAGCTWICARCAESLAAQVPGSICAVDVNLRNPSLHRYFSLTQDGGFVEAMKDTRPVASFARRIGESNLWVMTSGATGAEPNGALNPARLHARFSELRAQFDYLLIDTPAAACFSDAILLARISDGAILVVGSTSTRRESARMVKDNFDAAGVPVLGVVLNKRTYPIPEALYRRL
ncbi:MAG TPA: CpsD/CapB family tyrosine-protein kinase [Candidatus Acidoferrales bacterium]